jgi:hypothetical protein
VSPKTKLLRALAGIEAHSPNRDEHMFSFENVSTGNFEPPAYIVAFLFLNVLGYNDFGSSEKVWWHTFFNYRGHVFLLRDYKFGSWSLEVRKGSPVPAELVAQVIGKIQSASRHADELLSLELKKKINDEKFWLHNGFSSLKAAYDFYAKELGQAIAALQKTVERQAKTKPSIGQWAKRMNEKARVELIVSYRAFPLLVSFFSLLEFLLDVFYAFERPAMSFFAFRKLNWQDRFKAVVQLPSGSEILKSYEKLLRLKRLFRNPLTHGLTNETSLLVPVPFGGLVPASYEHLESSVHFGSIAVSEGAAVEALETFNGLLSHLSASEPFAYYMRYADNGFSIPIQKNEIAALKAEMTSLESFDEYLREKSAYQDAVTNRDI